LKIVVNGYLTLKNQIILEDSTLIDRIVDFYLQALKESEFNLSDGGKNQNIP